MIYDPRLDFETDTSELTPGQAHDRWEDVTNLQADDLERLEDSGRNELYLEEASDQRQTDDPPIPGGPLEDAQHLATTPRDEWGPDERAEAEEAINYAKRALPQFENDAGDPLMPVEEPQVHKAEIALARWGIDPEPEDSWP